MPELCHKEARNGTERGSAGPTTANGRDYGIDQALLRSVL